MSTYLVVYTMDDWQNNQQGHHNLCKKRQMDKDKSLLGTTDTVFVFMGWHLGYAFNFIAWLLLFGVCFWDKHEILITTFKEF